MSAPSSEVVLRCSGIRSGYKDAIVVRDVAFAIERQKIFAILGKNGMGKSTLLKTLMGFLRLSAGKIELSGRDITGLAPEELARRGVAYIPQEAAIFHDLTVEENLRLGTTSDRYLARGLERICAYFPVIPQRRRQKAGTLSGGEQKMLLMARALMGEPRLMLIDEISEGLQPAMVTRMAEVLKRLSTEGGTTILMAEQNVNFVSRVCDVVAFIKIGQIAEERRLERVEGEEQALLEKMRI
jgi:branched-chain amino acid transport system ATP-binding protein